MSHETFFIKLNRISKIYPHAAGSVRALNDVCLSMKRGDSLAIMGPSGSGKSTLLHVIGCLDSPSSGSYELLGNDVSRLSDQQRSGLRSEHFGFVFQFHHLMSHLTVYENVAVPLLYHSKIFSEDEKHDRIHQSLEKMNIQHRAMHFPSQLSGGEAQRAAIARALVLNPLLVLADEPTGSLDKENKQHILESFKTLNEQGISFIIVTHDAQVAACCRRVLIMEDGVLRESV